MTEWNPVEGLEKVEADDLRAGDVVRIKQTTNTSKYYQIVVKEVNRGHGDESIAIMDTVGSRYYFYKDSGVHEAYLVERPLVEPEGLGTLVYIFEGDSDVEVKVFIRIRHKNEDTQFERKSWVDSSTGYAYAWEYVVMCLNDLKNGTVETVEANYWK